VSKQNPSNIAASLRQRLLNLAHERKDEFQLVLIRYGIERVLYRLSQSKHGKRFVLKGAMLFQLWTSQPHRSTLDLDLLNDGADESVADFVKLFEEVCNELVEDDGLVFDTTKIRGEAIREDQRYQGVRIHADAALGSARIPIQIDIGFGDAITPKAMDVAYPTLLQQPAPILRAYPKETVIAEKWEAMVSLGIANSRMKDFYDLWVLSHQFEFDGAMLARAIVATFKRRGTALPTETPVALTTAFATDRSKQPQWAAFIKRGKLTVVVPPFEQVIEHLSNFLWPLTESVGIGRPFAKKWTSGGTWA
jgi:predicted nucleotidyltransferase component of viral defense system